MTDKPILFSGPMVRALLDGRKTMTRRVIKPQPVWSDGGAIYDAAGGQEDYIEPHWVTSPKTPYAVGDRLWVKEAWRAELTWQSFRPADIPHEAAVFYECDGSQRDNGLGAKFRGRLRPSMFMPRWASRITLLVTDVRVQRLQDISEMDALAEGVFYLPPVLGCVGMSDGVVSLRRFRELWDSLNAKRDGGAYAWAKNPWVVAYTFKPFAGNIDNLKE